MFFKKKYPGRDSNSYLQFSLPHYVTIANLIPFYRYPVFHGPLLVVVVWHQTNV